MFKIKETEKSNYVWYPMAGSQLAFLTCPLPEVLYEGTRGNGKTICLLADFAQHVGQGYGPSWRGILFRKSYKELEKDIIPKSMAFYKQVFGEKAKWNGGDKTWTWDTGEKLYLAYYERVEDYWNYHGSEFPWIGWEELTTWGFSDGYDDMKTIWRSPNPAVPRKYRATTNPLGPGHNWVKKHFAIGEVQPGEILTDKQGLQRTHIHGELWENPFLMENDPQYFQQLLATKDPNKRKAWLEGRWDIVAGGALDDLWDADVHVIPAFSIPSTWHVDRSFDWGSSKPFSVGWWAESDGSAVLIYDKKSGKNVFQSFPPKTLFRIAEWYGWNGKENQGLRMTSAEIARKIHDAEMRLPYHVHPGPADPSIFKVEDGHCIADEMSIQGVTWERGDNSPGSRANGLEVLRNRLEASTQRPMENPGIFIFENCRHFMRTVPNLPRDTKKMDDIDTSAEDHVYDDSRYRVLYRKQEGAMVHARI
jgi:hypothetical protein